MYKDGVAMGEGDEAAEKDGEAKKAEAKEKIIIIKEGYTLILYI